MAKTNAISLILILHAIASLAQSNKEIDSLLTEISRIENSKQITVNSAAIKLISYGSKALMPLTSYFLDSTQTRVKSDCQGILLNKGEIAIIIADRIEMMPYALLTGVQNCLLKFCDDNPNLIEYYLNAVKKDGVQIFRQRYSDWLWSSERKKWPFNYTNKKMKKRSQ